MSRWSSSSSMDTIVRGLAMLRFVPLWPVWCVSAPMDDPRSLKLDHRCQSSAATEDDRDVLRAAAPQAADTALGGKIFGSLGVDHIGI